MAVVRDPETVGGDALGGKEEKRGDFVPVGEKMGYKEQFAGWASEKKL